MLHQLQNHGLQVTRPTAVTAVTTCQPPAQSITCATLHVVCTEHVNCVHGVDGGRQIQICWEAHVLGVRHDGHRRRPGIPHQLHVRLR